MQKVTVVGGGLAGVETAYYLARRGIPVRLIDSKPKKFTPAHSSLNFGELVCSNSLKSDDVYGNACGLLKEEMRLLGSLVIESADKHKVPAGGALAVEREGFSAYITEKIKNEPLIEIVAEEVTALPALDEGITVIATGPLTLDALAADIQTKFGNGLHFYDASAPIVSAESVDMHSAFIGDRYGKGTGDYINCPMNKEEYEAFVEGLLSAEKVTLHDFEKKEIFESCMPVEIMASGGMDTLRFGTFKPVGLYDENGKRYYAVLQLRKEYADGTAYNLVGCQTNLKFGEQKRVFSLIPALKNAEFLRYGVMHRNTYLNSPDLLNSDFSCKTQNNLYFAGQITGVEGYVESAMSGLLVGVHIAERILAFKKVELPPVTVCGALSSYIATPNADFQPMNANYGVLPPVAYTGRDKKEKRRLFAERALEEIKKIRNNLHQPV
ncbi:MAG: methylenetetrahydrofolate--tRNA-(uracil(54)-C(5))-methyltransferase (FADH(2)-oxidizing) TrmFO [Clostridia bacterium]|nr:methylenetetrahydrofolate--tRNA-(uracil(54)-C(5))-methyltransferase (FADH(2)-oxidizing) TrmFO [Clostridia bacterium]